MLLVSSCWVVLAFGSAEWGKPPLTPHANHDAETDGIWPCNDYLLLCSTVPEAPCMMF